VRGTPIRAGISSGEEGSAAGLTGGGLLNVAEGPFAESVDGLGPDHVDHALGEPAHGEGAAIALGGHDSVQEDLRAGQYFDV
jgi:hypothetical protein